MAKKDRDYKFEGQHEDEELLMFFRQHPIVMRKGFVAVLIMMTAGLIPVIIWPTRVGYLWFGLLGALLGGIALFYQWIGWYYSVYYVSDQRIIQVRHKGLFTRSVVDVGLDKIQNINFQIKGIQETTFKYGTIVIQTFAGDLVMEKIHHPAKIQESVVKIIKELGYGSYMENVLSGGSDTATENGEEEQEES